MNEIQLSNDINIITAEINSYKQVAGQAIFEIGKRLKHVKENNLIHGEWDKWCKNSLGMERQHANRFIKVYDELGDSNGTSMFQLGVAALYEIATLPREEREKEHTLSSGETKTVDEMTVRELKEVKKKLKETEEAKQQAERQVATLQKSEQSIMRKLEELEDREPEIIEKEVVKEVVPPIVQKELESTKNQLEYARRELEKFDELKKEYELKKSDFDEEEAERERKKLEWEADQNVLRLKIKVDKFMEEVAITAFMEGAIAASGPSTKKKLTESVEQMKSFIYKMETVLRGRIEI